VNDIAVELPSGVDLAETRLLRSPTRVCTASVRLLPELPPISDYLLAAIPLRVDSLNAIGLKDRVEALGGTIWVVSPPAEGTTLHVRLPGHPSAATGNQRSALGGRVVQSAP
jgi:hypothetical protein